MPDRAGPAYFLRAGETRLLVDCGPGALVQLARAGESFTALDGVFITRLSTQGIRFVALFSDGAEKQIGARDLIGLLRDQSETDALDQLHDGLDRRLNASRPIDDLTLMVAEVPV